MDSIKLVYIGRRINGDHKLVSYYRPVLEDNNLGPQQLSFTSRKKNKDGKPGAPKDVPCRFGVGAIIEVPGSDEAGYSFSSATYVSRWPDRTEVAAWDLNDRSDASKIEQERLRKSENSDLEQAIQKLKEIVNHAAPMQRRNYLAYIVSRLMS